MTWPHLGDIVDTLQFRIIEGALSFIRAIQPHMANYYPILEAFQKTMVSPLGRL